MNHIKKFPFLNLFPLVLFLCVCARAQYTQDDWEWRDGWMNLDTLWKITAIKPGQTVGDLGANRGYFSFKLADRVGNTGRVIAADIRADYLDRLEEIAKQHQYLQIETRNSEANHPGFDPNSLDWVFVMDTYHEIREYKQVLTALHKALRSGGRIVILEKVRSRVKGKSRRFQTDAHSLGANYVINELEDHGFVVLHHIENMGEWKGNPKDPFWAVVAQKSD